MSQIYVFGVLVAALGLFVWGRWRYDLVALATLLAVVAPGIVEPEEAFLGFGHPAVVTVAAVLVLSRGLESAGVAKAVARWVGRTGDRELLQLSLLTVVTAVSSAFMNNVGALALFLPVAIQVARARDRPASVYLMPLAFGSLLGGLTTLVGTPPNIIIASFRAEEVGSAFGMFDFGPVGGIVAVVGVAFLVLVGWRFLPERKGEARPDELFEVEEYLSEVLVPAESEWIGSTLEAAMERTEADVIVLGIVRGEREIAGPVGSERLRSGDVLVVEAESDELDALLADAELEPAGARELRDRFLASGGDVEVTEAVVQRDSDFEGRTARELELRARHGVNLLGVAREGRRVSGRVADIAFQPGDVLLLQGSRDSILAALGTLGGLPLAGRGLEIGRPRRLPVAAAIFGVAVALPVVGALPVQVSLTAGAVAMVISGVLSPAAAYDGVQWPVIVLLGAMLPVGDALESTGGARTLAAALLETGEYLPAESSVVALLVVTMLLSNVINNAAATVLMAPIGLAIARGLQASVDPFLMAVAVGASCAFLTPIGHQSNTLVMGPGGYRFGDFLYLGLPVTLLVVVTASPLILLVWPL